MVVLALLSPPPVAAHPDRFAPASFQRAAIDRHPGHEAQNEARREMRAGNVHSLRDIERSVLPTMRGTQYLGPEYDPEAMAYRLKFIRDGRVTFVDVDARTGQVLSRTR